MGLTQSRLANANYHAAADDWLALVQFKDVADDVLPRVYLAWPFEIAAQLKAASGGRGDTVRKEHHTRGPKAAGAGTVERIPDAWRMSRERVEQLLTEKVASAAKMDAGKLGVIVKLPEDSNASGSKICPECDHVFQGKGWDGIDAHWKANHAHIMRYEQAWPLIKSGNYKRS